MGRMRFLRPIEFTKDEALLDEQKFSVDFPGEETKECPNQNNDGFNDLSTYNTNQSLDEQPKKVLHAEENSLVFKDNNLTVHPVSFKNDKGEECFSFVCLPK